MEFIQWLKKQVDRNDSIGDLARELMDDRRARRFKSYARFRTYLEEKDACDGAIYACEDAYKEFNENYGSDNP